MVVATVAALQARAGGGEGSAPILVACDQGMMMRARGRRMYSGAQGSRRDGPPSQPAGTGSDALVREGNGGEIASSVPAEVRARAETAYEQAYTPAPLTLLAEPYPCRAEPVHSSAHTRAYRAYLGASPALGDPTATPVSGDYKPLCNTQVNICLWDGCWQCGQQTCCKYTSKTCAWCTGENCCCKRKQCFDIASGDPTFDGDVCYCGG
jgi:hypothetical protein